MTVTNNKPAITSDEKLMSAIAHVFGPLGAIIVWAIQKDKSRFVKFQSLQALIFDVLLSLGMGLFFTCIFGVSFLTMTSSLFSASNDFSSPDNIAPFFFFPFMMPTLMFGCIFPFSFLIIIYRLFVAISILNGKDFRYPIIGKWLDNFLEN